MTDRAKAIELVLDAWTIEGVSPAAHRDAKRRLRQQWPRLFEALRTLEQVEFLETIR